MASVMHWMVFAKPQAPHSADSADRFFSLDADTEFPHSMHGSEPAKRQAPSNLMFAFSLVSCIANLLTSLFSNLI